MYGFESQALFNVANNRHILSNTLSRGEMLNENPYFIVACILWGDFSDIIQGTTLFFI